MNSATAAIAGFASRQHDDEQDPQLAAAVDPRGVEVRLRDRHEELAQQEDRERVAEPVGDDQRRTACPIRSACAHIEYSGTIVTCGGSIIATSVIRNTASRPLQRSRDSA